MTEESIPPPPKRLGRPPTEVPEALATMLEASYVSERGQRPISVQGAKADEVRSLLRLARIYCRRQGKTLKYQLQDSTLWLGMADKRPYRRNP